ncbi:DUF185 domain-containing protein [Lophium mytilinum]|uniref:Protein arginine methyltransferase NDUFAF7 n=1 Tax=Lophium mytilinum TaxID=390894 RepID=A0A6A6R7N6_9PEZI|nr:DUF185 domain-containing protein [Lophium mytilinum]
MKANPRSIATAVSRCLRQRPVARPSFASGARWSSSESRQWSTPLAKSLAEAITTTGPVSVAAYMRQCLTSPDGGYYTSRNDEGDQFGRKGDFITSPEISQVFGELVGVWVVAEWIAQGKKSSGVHIMEVGPGRGTLMDDMLRTIRNFKPMADSVEAIYMIEASPSLRDAQKKLLCGDAVMEEIDIGFQSKCKYFENLNIIWCEDIRFIPKDATKSPFIIAHEFFDALPIHVFQSIEPTPDTSPILTPTGPIPRPKAPPSSQWRELLISPTPEHSPSSTTPSPLDFQLTLSTAPTPHSQYLPLTSPRYTALAKTPGSIIEISPESLSYAADFATRIGGSTDAAASPPSGAALILDYGPSATIPTNSLRGIRAHTPVSPLAAPGRVDISADVDFVALAEAAIKASPGVEVHGPVEQGVWLGAMGIRERAEVLVRKARGKKGEEGVDRIEEGWKRLVDRGPTGMGRIYKAMAIVPHVPGKEGRRPVGFGGDVGT